MSGTPQTDSEILSAIDDLRLSAKKSIPWTIGAAVLTLAAFAFAIWTVWSMQREISELTGRVAQLQEGTAASDRRNQALTGTLRTIYARPGLDPTTRGLVGEALGYARENATQLAQVTASAAATATAVEQIGASQQTVAPPPQSTSVVSNGTSDGWDIDIFWCDSGSDPAAAARNREKAESDARRLADHRGWPNETTLGRVRVRPLAERLQGRGYPTAGSGLVIRPESTRAEQEVARAMMALLNTADGAYTLGGSRQQTRWYISMFVCR